MSKNLKKIFAVLLSFCLVLGLSVVAFADDEEPDDIACPYVDEDDVPCEGVLVFDDETGYFFCEECENEFYLYECKCAGDPGPLCKADFVLVDEDFEVDEDFDCGCYAKGFVLNRDTVTAADARIALRISSKLVSEETTDYDLMYAASDLNGDGFVRSWEARLILRYSSRLETTLDTDVSFEIEFAHENDGVACAGTFVAVDGVLTCATCEGVLLPCECVLVEADEEAEPPVEEELCGAYVFFTKEAYALYLVDKYPVDCGCHEEEHECDFDALTLKEGETDIYVCECGKEYKKFECAVCGKVEFVNVDDLDDFEFVCDCEEEVLTAADIADAILAAIAADESTVMDDIFALIDGVLDGDDALEAIAALLDDLDIDTGDVDLVDVILALLENDDFVNALLAFFADEYGWTIAADDLAGIIEDFFAAEELVVV